MTRVHGTWLAGVVLLGAAAWMMPRAARSAAATGVRPGVPAAPARHSQAATAHAKPAARPATASPARLPALPLPVESPYAPGSAQDQQWLTTRITELNDLAWFNDAHSLQQILAELRHPLPEIQAAALAATRAFGSREAIPYLKQLAAAPHPPPNRQELLDVIAYLELPTLVERLGPTAAAAETQPAGY